GDGDRDLPQPSGGGRIGGPRGVGERVRVLDDPDRFLPEGVVLVGGPRHRRIIIPGLNASAESSSVIDLSGFRVLVVDDEESIRFGLTRLAAQRGAETDSAESIGRAVAAAERFRPDAILLDLKLPDCDGLDGLARIREARPESRVVM